MSYAAAVKRERARSCGGYQEEKIRRAGGRKKEEKKDLFAQVYIHDEGVPPTLKVAKYIRFFCKKKGSFAVNETAVMDNAAAR